MREKVDDELNGRLKEMGKSKKYIKKGSKNNISIYSSKKKIILRCLSVSRRSTSRPRYVVKKRKKEKNNFSIHKNLQNIRKKI